MSSKTIIPVTLYNTIIEKADYYSKQEASASKEFVKTGKQEARHRAMIYSGQTKAYTDTLNLIEPDTKLLIEEQCGKPLAEDKPSTEHSFMVGDKAKLDYFIDVTLTAINPEKLFATVVAGEVTQEVHVSRLTKKEDGKRKGKKQ